MPREHDPTRDWLTVPRFPPEPVEVPLVARRDHWKRQPRDPGGEGGGQWVDAPGGGGKVRPETALVLRQLGRRQLRYGTLLDSLVRQGMKRADAERLIEKLVDGGVLKLQGGRVSVRQRAVKL